MFTKPTFGQTTAPSFGGFSTPGTTAQAGTPAFGQNAFNKPATAAPGFAAPSFGTGSALFGGTAPTTSSGIFGTTSTPAFGQPAQQTSAGFSGFNAGATTPLFGSNAGVGGFGQAKPAFGGFGTSTANTGLFGSPSTSTVGQPGSTLFNQSPNLFGSSGFGGAPAGGAATLGTPIKFNAPTGTDSMVKNGLNQTINTRHQCITAMKEYENKSLEELRLEDLQAGRRGPTGGEGLFGAPGAAQPGQTSLFGTPALGQPGVGGTGFGENKSLFGATATTSAGLGFGTTSTAFGAGQQNSLFGKTAGFGATTTTSATGFSFNNNTTTANPFGAANQNKPFGAPATGSLFGSQPAAGNVFGGAQPTTGFGTNTFGAQPQQQQQGIGLFGQNKPATPFGITPQQPATSTGFGFGQNNNNAAQGGLFVAKPQLGGLGTSFGTTSVFGAKPAGTTPAPAFGSTPFGAPTSTALGGATPSLFGQNTFNKPAATAQPFGFGQTQPGTSVAGGLGSGGLFGSTMNKPATTGGLFGTSGGGLFGGTTNTTPSTGFNLGTGSTFGGQGLGTGGLSLGQTPSLNFNPNKHIFSCLGTTPALGQMGATGAQDVHQKMMALVANPYDRPLFRSLPSDKLDEMMQRPTNPAAQKAVLGQSPSYSISASKVRLPVSPKVTMTPSKKSLFEGLEPSTATTPNVLVGSANSPAPTFEYRRLILRRVRRPDANTESTANATENAANARESDQTQVGNSPLLRDATPEATDHRVPIATWLAQLPEVRIPLALANSEAATDSQTRTEEKESTPQEPQPARRLALDDLRTSHNESNFSVPSAELSDTGDRDVSGPPHPAGIVLRRPGYFTIPSMDELATMTNDSGQCIVDDFTISRENYGNIFFEGPLDVSGLNLDDLVFIRHRQVVVYPDDDDKPPFGQGLNRKAQVTLDNVYPINKQTREFITNPEGLAEMDYEGFLRRKCLKMDTHFVEYRPETGSFVFGVPHFSKYTISEEAEENEERQKQLQQQQQQAAAAAAKKVHVDPKQKQVAPQQAPVTLQSPLPSTSVALRLVGDEHEPMNEVLNEPRSTTDLLSRHSGIDACKMRLMKASLFMDMEESYQESHASAHEDFHHNLLASMLETPPPSVGIPDRPLHLDVDMPEEIEEARIRRPRLRPVLKNPSFQMMPARIPEKACTSTADAALFFNRSFKVGWGPKGSLYIPTDLSVNIVTPYKPIHGFENWVETHLSVQLQYSIVDDVALTKGLVPRRGPRPGLGALEAHCHALPRGPITADRDRLIQQVLRLCLALWGPVKSLPEDAQPALVSHRRREALVEWLQDVIITEEQMKGMASEPAGCSGVLQCLVEGQILESVTMSQDRGEHYSALVLSTAGSGDFSRQNVQRQLQDWVSAAVTSLVHPQKLRAWMLAGGGLPLLRLEDGDLLNALDGLDWLTCLAVHFWYICNPGASIPDVVSRYEQAFNDPERRFAAPPVPSGGSEDSLDVRFHLLKLFGSRTYALEPILRVESHFPDYSLDSSLGWLLMMILDSLRYNQIDEHCVQRLNLAFSEQLIAAGLWHWAVFVLQHIPDQAMRQSAVEQVIDRHVTLNNSSWAMPNELSPQEEFVVSKLNVPATIVFRAKAYLASCQQKHAETACYQLHAEEWQGCHETVVTYLAADAIINESSGVVMRLLRGLQPHKYQIVNWNCQGQVFLDYLCLQEELRGLQRAGLGLGTSSNIEALHQRVLALISKIEGLPNATPKDRLCQSEIAHQMVSLAYSMLTTKDVRSPGRKFAELVSAITTPDDHRLRELQQATTRIMDFLL